MREYTRAPVILLASGDCSGLLEEALEDGVADLVPLPQLTENIVFAIRKAYHQGRRAHAGDGRRGRVITVFSPKGGVGKTVVSTNLAVTLCKMGKSTLLLDLDLQFGDAAIMLGLQPDKTIYDLVVAPGELDSEKLAGYTLKHPCGLDVLPAPLQPEDAELVTEGKLARLLEVARGSYDAIVVDTSPFFHGPMLATLDRTDDLILLCGLDVPTIKNVRLSLQTLELLSFPSERVGVVLNRANTNVGIQRAEVERALETKIRADLPSDRAVPLGVNRGKPVSLNDPGADFAKAIVDLAKGLMADTRQVEEEGRRQEGHPLPDAELVVGLHDRINGPVLVTQDAAAETTSLSSREAENGGSRARRQDPYAELKTRVHHACIAQLGPELFATESPQDLEERVMRTVMEQLALDRTPLTREERRQIVADIADDILGYGPLEPFLRDDTVTEIMVNGPEKVYVERTGKIERDGRDIRRRRARAAHHRQDRLADRPSRRRVVADGRRPPPGREPCERDHPAARPPRADAHDPEVLARPVHDGRPHRVRLHHEPRRRTSWPRA